MLASSFPTSLEWIDFLLFGCLGFLVTVLTFLNARSAKQEVSRAFAKIEFRDDIKGYITNLEEATKQLEKALELTRDGKEINAQLAQKISLMLSKLLFSFKPAFDSSTTKEIQKGIDFANSIVVSESADWRMSKRLFESLVSITAQLRQEEKK